jgi:2-hydroxymuconate-semialdehyde hydrolase
VPIKEYDLEFEGTSVHCYEGGRGYPILMIHGSGPGTASMSNWVHVMRPLAKHYHILAMDLVGYGRSGRKADEPFFDIELWTRQARFVLKRLARSGPAGVIGHSLGGFLALRLAAREPRINKALVQGSLGARMRMNHALRVAWTFPRNEAAFRLLYRYVTRNTAAVSQAFVRDRLKLIGKEGYGAYFSRMFQGDKQRYLDQAVLSGAELKKLKCDLVLLHGDQDLAVPFEQGSLRLAASLPHADVVRLANCGHPCSFDQPEKFVKVARALFG